jgi:hypothetical protein
MTDAMPASDAYARTRPATHLAIDRTSHYVTMPDGARIAIDVHLPVDRRGPLPTLIRQTRYFRSLEPTRLGQWLGESRVDPVNGRMRRYFVARGYAWIDVDVRGSGASTGVWHSPWSPLEVEDGRAILDWIVAQPWSNGKVGATGNSYDGTAAELMATLGHPALVACAPRCSLYDVYTDVAYPGGVRQEWFTAAWTRANQALDANHPETMVAEAISQARPWLARGPQRRALEGLLRLIFRRVRPVDGDHAAVQAALGSAPRISMSPPPRARSSIAMIRNRACSGRRPAMRSARRAISIARSRPRCRRSASPAGSMRRIPTPRSSGTCRSAIHATSWCSDRGTTACRRTSVRTPHGPGRRSISMPSCCGSSITTCSRTTPASPPRRPCATT